ncbi:hypothetical protein [Paenibacillus ihumii]
MTLCRITGFKEQGLTLEGMRPLVSKNSKPPHFMRRLLTCDFI